MHVDPERALALVADHHVHAGGLADEAGGGLDGGSLEMGDQAAHPDAAHLLVVGECKMDRAREVAHVGHRGEAAGEEPFHVGRAAAVEAAVARGEAEGVAAPGLAVDRNHVGMPGQHIAGLPRRSDGRPQIGLAAARGGDPLVDDAEPIEIVFDPRHRGQIGVATGGVEADQGSENLGGVLQATHAAFGLVYGRSLRAGGPSGCRRSAPRLRGMTPVRVRGA